MAFGNFNLAGGVFVPPIGFVWLSIENVSPATYFKNTIWELISQNRVLMGAGNGHNGGDTIEAGLPNITGTMRAFNWTQELQPTGTFGSSRNLNRTKRNLSSIASSSSDGAGIYTVQETSFDSSLANSIYGNSTTVQPAAYYVYIWRRLS